MTERSGAVGQSWPRADAEAKVRGTFRYTADEPAGRCCYVGAHRASRPHARIGSVRTDAAREVPGVNAVRDATGVRCTTLPLTPERLLAAMTAAGPASCPSQRARRRLD
jgi:CO/xanthine dehydrogenase Mo-binding subunit